jgi:hypothetical protein
MSATTTPHAASADVVDVEVLLHGRLLRSRSVVKREERSTLLP